jgi:transposase-like protein
MTSVTTKPELLQSSSDCCAQLFEGWIDPIESNVRARVRTFIEELIREELDAALARPRYGRRGQGGNDGATAGAAGHRHGSRKRTLLGTFGKTEIAVPRARLHDEITADYNDMIYAATREEIEARRKAFIRKWRVKHRAVADSLEEAGERLFTFTRLPPDQWRSVRTTNAIERLHEEFKRRIKTQTVLPSADTAAMLFWALLASGQINMRKVDGWQTLAAKPIDQPLDLAA